MNLLSLVGPRLDNIYQIRRKCYYSSGWNFFQSKQGLCWASVGQLLGYSGPDWTSSLLAALSCCHGHLLQYFILNVQTISVGSKLNVRDHVKLAASDHTELGYDELQLGQHKNHDGWTAKWLQCLSVVGLWHLASWSLSVQLIQEHTTWWLQQASIQWTGRSRKGCQIPRSGVMADRYSALRTCKCHGIRVVPKFSIGLGASRSLRTGEC